MAFRIRRGLKANLGSMDPAPVEGELLYTTDTKGLYVGDDQGVANLVSSSVVRVNNYEGVVELFTDDIPEDGSPTNLWFTNERAQDAVALAVLGSSPVSAPDNSIHTRITFTYNDTTNRLSASVAPSGTVNTGTTNSLAYYATNSDAVSDSNYLKWNNTSKTLTLDESKLRITATFPFQYMGQFDQFGDDQYGGWMVFRRARGTEGSPQVTQDQDFNTSLIWASYDGSTSIPPYSGYALSAAISAGSDGDPVAPGYYPGWLVFSVTGNGKVLQDVGRWDQFGKLTIGPYFGTEQANGALSVIQTISATSDTTVSFANVFDDANGPQVFLTKIRGQQQAYAAAQTGDILGEIIFNAKDTVPDKITGYTAGARIRSTIIGTVDDGIAPSDLTISSSDVTGTLVDAINITSDRTEFLTKTLFTDGTASEPSIGFYTDGGVDTGIFHPGDGILCISTDTTERVRIDNGGMRVAGFMKVADVNGTLPSPAEAGMIVLDGSTFKGYNGSAWVTLG